MIYNNAGQLTHIWKYWLKGRLRGARRCWKEHFTVYVHDLTKGVTRAIPSPSYGYYADPFIWQYNGSIWLFVEEYEYAKDKGRLVVMELTESLEAISSKPLTSPQFYGNFDCHVSFPHLFELNGSVYMVPETCERKSVDLYICEQWPDQWRLERRLLSELDAADTMVLKANGYWWLITSVRAGQRNRHLEIYFTDDLLAGTIQPHPENNSNLYKDDLYGTGRNAGFFQKSLDGTLIRLTQKSERYYGESISIMKVEILNAEQFSERPVDCIQDLPIVKTGFNSHHVSRVGNLIAYDTRDRAR